MKVLKELKYAKSHEWVKIEGGNAYMGLTDYAKEQLGQIVFIDLPEIDVIAEADESLAEVESVKAVSEVISPVSGKVIGVNEELINKPELVNEDAYGNWLVLIEMSDPKELEKLMDSQEYEDYCNTLREEGKH